MISTIAVWCDGGVILKNPSKLGGTWAFTHVDKQGIRVHKESGLIEPGDLGLTHISNNITELIAAIRALKSLPEDWEGTLYTDSAVTMHRLMGTARFVGCPGWLTQQVLHLRRTRELKVSLVAGHPTKADLLRGWKKKSIGKLPVSEHNQWCDHRCQAIAANFLSNRKQK